MSTKEKKKLILAYEKRLGKMVEHLETVESDETYHDSIITELIYDLDEVACKLANKQNDSRW